MSLDRIPTLRAHQALTTLFRLSESGLALEWPPKSIRELFAGHIGRYLQDTMVASFEGTPADQFDRRAPTESGPLRSMIRLFLRMTPAQLRRIQISEGTSREIGISSTVGTSFVHAFAASALIAPRSSTRTPSQP